MTRDEAVRMIKDLDKRLTHVEEHLESSAQTPQFATAADFNKVPNAGMAWDIIETQTLAQEEVIGFVRVKYADDYPGPVRSEFLSLVHFDERLMIQHRQRGHAMIHYTNRNMKYWMVGFDGTVYTKDPTSPRPWEFTTALDDLLRFPEAEWHDLPSSPSDPATGLSTEREYHLYNAGGWYYGVYPCIEKNGEAVIAYEGDTFMDWRKVMSMAFQIYEY